MRRLLYRLGLAASRIQDPNRKEGFWERLFRWWP
jgi:hypothetical protein